MKKYIIRILTIFTLILALISCENNDNLDPVGNWNLSEPTLMENNEDTLYLQQERPDELFYFEWEKAVSSAGFQVRYSLVLDTVGSTNYNTPIFSVKSDNSGKGTSASLKTSDLDLALSYAGFPAGKDAALEWAVIATSQDARSTASKKIIIKRFDTDYIPKQLFLVGAATETGKDLASSRAMQELKSADAEASHIFEIFTHLEAGKSFKLYSKQKMPAFVYGGNEGVLEKNGIGISVDEAGEYRVTVNLNDNTYSMLKIDKWSIVGNVIPDGWGGDQPLAYAGDGKWQAKMTLNAPGSDQGEFIFRANGDWGYVMKLIQGISNQLYMESQAESAGLTVGNLQLPSSGKYKVTLDLSAAPYSYSLEKIASPIQPPSETPETLFLLSNEKTIGDFELEDGVFSSTSYLALQKGVAYQLNSKEDGSGTAYILTGAIGSTENSDGDSVAGTLNFGEGEGDINIDHDQAYKLAVNFTNGNLNWQYYNMKLFHWDDPNDGWDQRKEFLMTYVHPYSFTTTQKLEANYTSKFNSPWDVEFGADDPNELQGSMTNKGGSNFTNISTTATYKVTIKVDDTFSTGTYDFVAQ